MADQLLETYPGINDVQVWKARAMIVGRHDEAAALAILRESGRDEARNDAEAWSTMAEILAMARDDALRQGKEALNIAILATNATGQKHARSLAAQAAAQAELGEFSSAVTTLQRALELASDSEKGEWEPRLAAYQKGTTYRYPGPTRL